MNLTQNKQPIKVYQIDRSFHKIKHLNAPEEVIMYIINENRKRLGLEQISSLVTFEKVVIEDVKYILYKFDYVDYDSPWKTYFPIEITENENFLQTKISFVLFAICENQIFAIIGGTGIFVVASYINYTFGLDVYERFAEPQYDVVNTIDTRGLTGNLTSSQETFKNEQILLDSLSFNKIPNRLNISLRKEIRDSVFDMIDFRKVDNVYFEIGSAFFIKWSITFKELHELVKRLGELLQMEQRNALSRFEQIKDESIQNKLLYILCDKIREDMIAKLDPEKAISGFKLDNDFVHPSNIKGFYECEKYQLFIKNSSKPFFETHDRKLLYIEGLKYLYNNVQLADRKTFNSVLLGMKVVGVPSKGEKIKATFVMHLTCEIEYNKLPVFLIDYRWYRVRGDFIENINKQCQATIKANYWSDAPDLCKWSRKNMTEGDYNSQYSTIEKFIVFDKVLVDNIEMCDVLYETESSLYFMHVKQGFDAKIRDLYNQIVFSAHRVWNDINSGEFSYISRIIQSYNSKNSSIDTDEFISKLNNKTIVYVLCFCSDLENKEFISENIAKSKSNIAKFSLIQCVQEMKASQYNLKIVEIEVV